MPHRCFHFGTHQANVVGPGHSLVCKPLFLGCGQCLLTSPTVVRAHGLQHVRAEKSWRPIVAVTVDGHQCHELNLGCDGQNPNLKQCFQL